jgi:antitoxin component YwqK of YwqJK toxin-antitoxin module
MRVFAADGRLLATLEWLDDVQHGPETQYRNGQKIVYLWRDGKLETTAYKGRPAEPLLGAPAGTELPDMPTQTAAIAQVRARKGIVKSYFADGTLQSEYPASGTARPRSTTRPARCGARCRTITGCATARRSAFRAKV